MNKKIVITSKFNIMTGSRNKTYAANENTRFDADWIENRVDIFMRFTAQSLMHQKNQDFTAVYAYEDSTKDIILEAFDNYDPLPDNILFVPASEYSETIDNLVKGYDYLYLCRLDTDDLYKNDFVQKLHDFPIKDDTQELLCQYGYMYDSVNNRIADYYHKQFTFYTFIYRLYSETTPYSSLNLTPKQFLIDFSHFETMNYKYELVPGRNFLFNIHGDNTNSRFYKYDYGFNRVDNIRDDSNEVMNIIINFF